MEITRLLKKSVETVKEYGIGIFFQKTKNYLLARSAKNKMRKQTVGENKRIFGDVLFINGCYLPHPSRYRVSHQREQMLANGMISEEVFYTDLSLDFIKRYRLFIFYRCPWIPAVDRFIKAAKSFNKTCLFDIDDLVIDTKYTDNIPYLSTLNSDERKEYDKGVNLMRRTLLMCDGAITTTETLAEELKNYTSDVFINRNVASDAMAQYSQWAVYNRDILPIVPNEQLKRFQRKLKRKIISKQQADKNIIKIGYFSGSITHNDDIDLILPVIFKVMQTYKQVHFYFVGELDIPEQLTEFKSRVHSMPFVDWTKLPELISNVDINIVPLCDTVFNAAKSENKWTEAALVKVPTVASRVGAMEKMITDGKTGLLCKNNEEWFNALSSLIKCKELRLKLAQNAFDYVNENCLTINTGIPLVEFIRSRTKPNIAFVLPSLAISGGVLVVLKHCNMLKKSGYDVLIINDNIGNKNIEKDGEEINVLSTRLDLFHGHVDTAVGTLWSTMNWVDSYRNVSNKAYLVQNYESRFYNKGDFLQFTANQTYSMEHITYITISKWCEKWLIDRFHQEAKFMPNGLEREMFPCKRRTFDGKKVRILVEGNSADYYKNVDESFKIVDMLDKSKYEIWFMSYLGEPKSWYRVDKFLHKVPYEKVAEIYSQCEILLKSSILESFSYPPLEMMATGGYVVVRPNEGNVEYLRDGDNCLMYDGNNLQTAVNAIEKIVSDEKLQQKLFDGGIKTADERSWENCRKHIIDTYKF